MAANDKSPGSIGEILAWLSAEPEDDPVEDLKALRERLSWLENSEITEAQRKNCLPGFCMRLLDINNRIIPRIISAPLPLTRHMHDVVSELAGAMLALNAVALDFFRDTIAPGTEAPVSAADLAQIQFLEGHVYLTCCMARMAAPKDLWKQTFELLRHSGQLETIVSPPRDKPLNGMSSPKPGLDYKRMLSLSVAQPEGLTSRELAWLFDYLSLFAPLADIAVTPPLQQETRWYWIDAKKGNLPVAMGRHSPPEEEGILFFCPTPIVKMVGEQISWLEN